MNAYVFILIVSLILAILSGACHYLMMRTVKFWQSLLISIVYFLLIILVFDGATILARFFAKRHVYIELGHADEMLLLPFICWLLIGFANVMLVVRKKQKRMNG